jgi:hypothetical protein
VSDTSTGTVCTQGSTRSMCNAPAISSDYILPTSVLLTVVQATIWLPSADGFFYAKLEDDRVEGAGV